MKIETKYEIGQECFFEDDDEWLGGKINGIFHNGIDTYYEIHVNELYRYIRLTESEIIIDEPVDFQKINEFLNLFPEFNGYERDELAIVVRKLRKGVAKRNQKDNKPNERTV